MVVRHPITVDEWHRMGEAGLFGEDARMELLDGEVFDMSAIGPRHANVVNRLTQRLVNAAGDRAVVSVQNPVVLDKLSVPQPDFAVLVLRDDYESRLPEPDDVLLLIEVADSSVDFDRGLKAALYSRGGIREYWVVDLDAEVVVVMRDPDLDRYQRVQTVGRGDVVSAGAVEGVALAVSDILG